MKKCCFAGHGDARDEIRRQLTEEAKRLVMNEGVEEFWVGNYGGFDRLAAGVVREIKKNSPEIRLCLVLPYITRKINENKEEYYCDFDEIIIADIPESTPAKHRIVKCNEYMVNKSDFLICFVNRSWGGAARTLLYAERKKHIKIINIA